MLTTTIRRDEIPQEEKIEEATTVAVHSRRWPLAAAMVGGLVLMALSAALAFHVITNDVAATPVAVAAGEPIEANADLVYEPGHTSGWHVHPGVHSVQVLSGTLTVYDEACGRRDYGPGETYTGGRAPHVVLNTGVENTALVVSYVADPSADGPGHPVPAPSGCEAS
jgi:quercetin dioxygenase-like cupin family protein